MTIKKLIEEKYPITRDGESFDLKLQEAATFGYLLAIAQIQKQEETFWTKNGIVNATSSWAKWLEDMYYKEDKDET